MDRRREPRVNKKFVHDTNFLKGPKRGEPSHLAAKKILEALTVSEVSQKAVSDSLKMPNSNFVMYMKGKLIPGIKVSQRFKEYFRDNFDGLIVEFDDWRLPADFKEEDSNGATD